MLKLTITRYAVSVHAYIIIYQTSEKQGVGILFIVYVITEESKKKYLDSENLQTTEVLYSRPR